MTDDVRGLVVVFLAGCIGDVDFGTAHDGPQRVSGPSDVVAPSDAIFRDVASSATAASFDEEADTISLDLAECPYLRIHAWLPLGSAWFLLHPVGGRYCEMWLGGETENPNYDGRPAQYCLFDRASTLEIDKPHGGPVILENMAWCVLLR